MHHVGVKGDKLAQRNRAGDNLTPADPQHQDKHQADQRRQSGHEQAPGANQFQVEGYIFAVGSVEAADFRSLLRIGANHAHPGQVFLCFRGKRGQRRLDRLVQRMNDFSEVSHRQGANGHRNEHPQTQ